MGGRGGPVRNALQASERGKKERKREKASKRRGSRKRRGQGGFLDG